MSDLESNTVLIKRALPKLRDIIRRQRQDSYYGGSDIPDLDFIYHDTDSHLNEIAELYSYTEWPEFALNVRAFEDQMEDYNLAPSWQRLMVDKQQSVVMKLVNQLDVSNRTLRMRAARCILYLAQGCWAEVQSDTEQQSWQRLNVIMLYQQGVFSSFVELLNIEIENGTELSTASRKVAISLMDSQDLRLILSVLYIITEVMRNELENGNNEFRSEVDAFCNEIVNASGEDLLVIQLLGMVTKFCSGTSPHFPMKKVLLLLWKLLLVSLGGMSVLRKTRLDKRRSYNLPIYEENSMEIIRTMRACSPPGSASDVIEAQNTKRNIRPLKRGLAKQTSLDDHDTSLGVDFDAHNSNCSTSNAMDEMREIIEFHDHHQLQQQQQQLQQQRSMDDSQIFETNMHSSNNNNNNGNNGMNDLNNTAIFLPSTMSLNRSNSLIVPRGLPWKPKVRQKDVQMFLENSRMKFVGFTLPDDAYTLVGLPLPIHEGIKVLRDHVYISLSECQIQREDELSQYPLSNIEDTIPRVPIELYYEAMLPNLPQYMIALLKILLAAAPTSKAKTDSINIMADVLPEEMPLSVLQSMKLGIDVNRHKEIIVKAVSAILLLFLKHFKLNHVYQFEFMSQHLVFANCIPLVLKFFNQNIMAYIGSKNIIPILDFPSCVIGDQPELTTECLEIGDDSAQYSWRNMFSCINLLRILNKLTKWKHSRIMMLVVFKSAPILKRTLKIRHAMTQLYVLKLLKMQMKYLGRQWRKSNMKIISAIYQKVRHRLNDDWAYGNDLDARPWDFQVEECALRNSVDRFNNRRYSQNSETEIPTVNTNLISVLGANMELSENFKNNYSLWLEQEVFTEDIQWERLLREQK